MSTFAIINLLNLALCLWAAHDWWKRVEARRQRTEAEAKQRQRHG
jgi:hypothetical protein